MCKIGPLTLCIHALACLHRMLGTAPSHSPGARDAVQADSTAEQAMAAMAAEILRLRDALRLGEREREQGGLKHAGQSADSEKCWRASAGRGTTERNFEGAAWEPGAREWERGAQERGAPALTPADAEVRPPQRASLPAAWPGSTAGPVGPEDSER